MKRSNAVTFGGGAQTKRRTSGAVISAYNVGASLVRSSRRVTRSPARSGRPCRQSARRVSALLCVLRLFGSSSGCAPHNGVATVDASAPDDRVAILARTPHHRVAVVGTGAPDDVRRPSGLAEAVTPNDVRAPDDRLCPAPQLEAEYGHRLRQLPRARPRLP